MKIKRIFASVAAFAVAGAMALSVSATTSLKTTKDSDFARVDVIGSHLKPEEAISDENADKIEKVRFTLVKQDKSCVDVGDDSEPCDTSADEACVTFVIQANIEGSTKDWNETKVCLHKEQSVTVPCKLKPESFLAFSIATWLKTENTAEFKIELLDKDGKVIALGAGTTPPPPPGPNPPNPNPDPKKGVGDIAILGGVALLATGAIIVTRRRAK
ncbi:MAG: hypothetical protein FWG45_01730 [Oscillospiraceae bacterium]|nr:hypothetical protein [Oscillospiraceae bacterium]